MSKNICHRSMGTDRPQPCTIACSAFDPQWGCMELFFYRTYILDSQNRRWKQADSQRNGYKKQVVTYASKARA